MFVGRHSSERRRGESRAVVLGSPLDDESVAVIWRQPDSDDATVFLFCVDRIS